MLETWEGFAQSEAFLPNTACARGRRGNPFRWFSGGKIVLKHPVLPQAAGAL